MEIAQESRACLLAEHCVPTIATKNRGGKHASCCPEPVSVSDVCFSQFTPRTILLTCPQKAGHGEADVGMLVFSMTIIIAM